MRPLLITICALTAFRVFAWSVRLALVEVVLPLALFPMFFISYLEIFRYPYLGSGRGFAGAVGICAILLISGRHKIKY